MNLHSALVTIAPSLSETGRDELVSALRDAASEAFDHKTEAVRDEDVTAADIYRAAWSDLTDAADYLEAIHYPKPSDPLERNRNARRELFGAPARNRADGLLDA